MKIWTFIITFLLVSSISYRTDYYVVKTCPNNGDGTSASCAAGAGQPGAWNLIASVSALSPGDTVYLEGEFRENLSITDSGSDGLPITYQEYGTGAYLLGSYDLDDPNTWELHSGNVWKTKSTLSGDVGMVFHDMDLISDDEMVWATKEQTTAALVTNWAFSFVNTSSQYDYHKLYVYLDTGNPAENCTGLEVPDCYDIGNIIDFDYDNNSTQGYVTLNNLNLKYGNNIGIRVYSGNTIKVNNCNLSYMGGRYYPLTSGIRIGTAITFLRNSSNCEVNNCTIHQIWDAGVGCEIFESSPIYTIQNIKVKDCNISNCQLGVYADILSNAGHTFKDFTYEGNTISHTGKGFFGRTQGNYSSGAWFSSNIGFGEGTRVKNVNFINNTVYDSLDYGVRITGVNGFVISGNRIYNNGEAGINFWHNNSAYPSSTGKIQNNVIYSTPGGTQERGIEIDGNHALLEIYNNTLSKNTVYQLEAFDNAENFIAKNNIFRSTNDDSGYTLYVATGSTTDVILDYNDFYRELADYLFYWSGTTYSTLSNYQTASSQDSHSIASDPLFRNAAGGDFRLKWGSPCINAGINLGDDYDMAFDPHDTTWPYATIDQDFFGPWEIGAYVYRRRLEVATRSWDQYLKMGIGLDLDMLMYSIVDGNVF